MKESQLKVITIKGTSYERGKQHGIQLKQEIQEICATNQKAAQEAGMNYFDYIQSVIKETQFYTLALKYCPSLIEEVRGIADGAGRKFEEIFVFNHFEENGWMIINKMALNKETKKKSFKYDMNCSALGTSQTENNHIMIGQNADNSTSLRGFETLIHAIDTESDLEWYHITYPGLLGIYGMNNYGVGVCINSISPAHTKSVQNMGSLYVARSILNCRTMEEAISFLKKVPHASGLNYLVGDSKNICCVETSAGGVHVIYSSEGSIFHTNHAFGLTDRDSEYLDILTSLSIYTEEEIKNQELDSKSRLNSLQTEYKKIDRLKTWKDFKNILSVHGESGNPVCRHGPPHSYAITNTSFVMELTEKPKLRICAGQPCKNHYQEFNFETKGSVKYEKI